MPEWFGLHRSLKEQMTGLDHALAECSGKSVLDLGCAEGLIGREFSKAGANVVGFDILESHIKKARENCSGHRMRLEVRDLNVESIPQKREYDIVLALAVLHKLVEPCRGAEYCAASAKSLVVIRLPVDSTGIIKGKHSGVECDLNIVMPERGFRMERTEQGPRGELVQYWRR